MKENPTGADIIAFLDRAGDAVLASQCDTIIPMVRAMAASYTRDAGFSEDDVLPDDLHALIVVRTARMSQNPLSLHTEGGAGMAQSDSFADDWNRQERRILDRYRKKTL